MRDTKIEWTDATVNLWWGCRKVAVGCAHCYAAQIANRYHKGLWDQDEPRYMTIKTAFKVLMDLQKEGKRENKKIMVFVGSMMDIFDEEVPLIDRHYAKLEGNVTTASRREALIYRIDNDFYPNLVFQFLTKRPQNIAANIPKRWFSIGAPENVWFGASVSTQAEAERDTQILIENTPAKSHRFLSIEPIVSSIDLYNIPGIEYINWIIVGGESGSNARLAHEPWFDKIIGYCRVNNKPLFVKQLGTYWAKKNFVYANDSKGGIMWMWPKRLQVRNRMPYDE